MSKKILGLDLGTNSIGWALIEKDENLDQGKILGLGSRIIPMGQDVLGDFGKGNSVSQTAERTRLRLTRRIRERFLLRRERLHRVLNLIGFLPEHYASQIDFEKRLGKFKADQEPKLAYKPGENGSKPKFLFVDSYEEMLNDFEKFQPDLVMDSQGNRRNVPYDWTIYYLRKKALNEKISKQELAWIILNFNQKRGYFQARGEEEEMTPNKRTEFHSLRIVDVIEDNQKKDETWYSLILENGWVYRRSSKISLENWKGKVKDFIVSVNLNEDGTEKLDKEGNISRSFRAPDENDWSLLKIRTEHEIAASGKFVGTFIYDELLKNPNQKIKGKLVRTIERKFYRNELEEILKTQLEYHPELKDEAKFAEAVRELYRNNENRVEQLAAKDFIFLFVQDIIFYQRPLRSKKSLISTCSLESRPIKDKNGQLVRDEAGKPIVKAIKCAAKSNPYFQEYRLLQWIQDLNIYTKRDDRLVTSELLPDYEAKIALFDFLNNKGEVTQTELLKFLFERKGLTKSNLKLAVENHRWNYVEDKTYPCNETRGLILNKLNKVDQSPLHLMDSDVFIYQLWHIIYSITDKEQYEKALRTLSKKFEIPEESFCSQFLKVPPFKSDYASYSEKALKKLLTLMRFGKYWNWNEIPVSIQSRIEKIIHGEFDPEIKDRVREKSLHLKELSDFQGLPLWMAKYIIYNRHSEAADIGKWNSVEDLENFLKEFKQHSLRNPIVEQVVLEALRVVREIWAQYGNGVKDFFQEIHIELGREMKHTKDERARLTKRNNENENTNLRIKALLLELYKDPEVKDVIPNSAKQQEILKIFEEGVLQSDIEIPEDILKLSKLGQPSSADLKRYKLWLEQKYISPYTGQVIPLNRLFTSEFEIEHIIPQSRYFDDSLQNKIICESAVNRLKDNQTAYEFIKNHGGQKVPTGFGTNTVEVMSLPAYEDFVKRHFEKNRVKKSRLLSEDIPEAMVSRQLNDTRYISKFISNVLSYLVRAEHQDDGVNSKNLVSVTGKITTELKSDWGLNDVWNDLVLPRFIRMNEITAGQKSFDGLKFTKYNEKLKKELPDIPLVFSRNFSKKRIDHRHHAMDALVVACATRNHVNFMNNFHAAGHIKDKGEQDKLRYDLRSKLCYKKYQSDREDHYNWAFKKPWDGFTVEAKEMLQQVIVSFKKNLRVINKSNNRYQKWGIENGNKVKVFVKQTAGMNWAIRKPLHKDTVAGVVTINEIKSVPFKKALESIDLIANKKLRRFLQVQVKEGKSNKEIEKIFKDLSFIWNGIEVKKVEVEQPSSEYVSTRKTLGTDFTRKKIEESVADPGIKRILIAHLDAYKNNPDVVGGNILEHEIAFSPEGIEDLNKNIVQLNGGKPHKPIFSIRVFETKGNKFSVGSIGNKSTKIVEAAKGTNLYFGVYSNAEGKRVFDSVPLNIVVERLKQGLSPVPEIDENGNKLLFYLNPNDLVYVPTEEEIGQNLRGKIINKSNEVVRVYKVVSFSGNQIFFIRNDFSTVIVNKVELLSLNKMERAIDEKGTMIKETCFKLKTGLLGNSQIV
jgi:CRISPR-associated endonuclease Csn1